MTQSDSSLLKIIPLPTPLAACSRLIKWRSTRICLSMARRLSIDSENAPAIWGKLSTAGRTASSALTRSAFFAQPGNGKLFKLRANRTRLDITIRSCGPSRLHDCEGGARNSLMFFTASVRGQTVEFFPGLLDFVAQDGRLFEILIVYGFLQLLLQPVQFFEV